VERVKVWAGQISGHRLVRRVIETDRLQIAPDGVATGPLVKFFDDRVMPSVPLVVPRGVVRAIVWALLGTLYAALFGAGIALAVKYMSDGVPAGAMRPPDAWTETVRGAVLISLVLVGLLWLVCGASPRRLGLIWSGRAGLARQLQVLAIYPLLTRTTSWLTDAAAGALDLPQHSWRSTVEPSLDGVVGTLDAGPFEELLLLGAVVWLLRSVGYSWTVVAVVAVVVRIPFHLYYGPAVPFGYWFWPLAAVFLYRYSGALLAFIVGHSLNNALAASHLWPSLAPWAELTYNLWVYAGIAVVVAWLWRWARQPDPGRASAHEEARS
jgi:hypothetical protein